MPKLVVSDREKTWLVDLQPGETLVVGRSSACDLRIAEPRASRRHLRIEASADGHLLRDLGSTNGTTLNGAPFSDAMALADGDAVDAAGCRIAYWSRP